MTASSNRTNLKVEHTAAGVVVCLAACAELNDLTTPPIQEQLLRLAGELGSAQLLLDLGGIRFLSSTGLGMLLALHKKLRAAGGRLAIDGVSEMIYEVFEATMLTRVLDVRRRSPGSLADG